MRKDSPYSTTNMHFHDGATCHGFPTLKQCLINAEERGWSGRILEQEDKYEDGTKVKCYSLIASAFQHWGQRGKWVARIDVERRVTHL